MIAAMSAMMVTMIFTVSADETTDLSDLKVYAIDNSGNQTEVPLDFNSTTYEYNLTVKSTVKSIKIEATAKDSTSQWSVEKDGINTIMDTGDNLTIVDVTSSTGAVQKYTLNTKKLTEAEDATYKEPSSKKKKTSKKTAVFITKQEPQLKYLAKKLSHTKHPELQRLKQKHTTYKYEAVITAIRSHYNKERIESIWEREDGQMIQGL